MVTFFSNLKRHLRYHFDLVLNEVYSKSGKWLEFLTQLEGQKDHAKAHSIFNSLIHPNSIIKAMNQLPEMEEKCKSTSIVTK